jgi:hypothetical protein
LHSIPSKESLLLWCREGCGRRETEKGEVLLGWFGGGPTSSRTVRKLDICRVALNDLVVGFKRWTIGIRDKGPLIGFGNEAADWVRVFGLKIGCIESKSRGQSPSRLVVIPR